ncbi:MAG: translation initiation factor IF-2 [Elainellaceae cyanobacterium]
MNNGKLRIYELSKELDLENRDILAICEKLEIPVKSHSSTITEDIAGKIRTEAQNYSPKASPSRAVAPNKRQPHASRPSPSSGVKPPIKKKQQILEIRKKTGGAELNAPQTELIDKPQVAKAESPATSESKPYEPTVTADQISQVDQVPSLHKPIARPVDQEGLSADQAGASSPDDYVSENGATPPPSGTPAIKKPRPVPPRARDVQGQTEAPGSSESSPAEVPVLRQAPRPPARPEAGVGRRSDADGESNGQSTTGQVPAPTLAPKPKLKRPVTRQQQAEAEEEAKSNESQSDRSPQEALVDESQLRRPVPPRPPRKTKRREEAEEDDEQERLLKAEKATKPKRRQPLIKDDEDDLDILDEDDSDSSDDVSQAQISLSLMRPPKPKGASGSPSKPTTSTPRRKKSGASRDSRSQRRDRRDQSKQQERPELITLSGSVSVHDLAEMLTVPETEVIRNLFFKGIAANINQILDIPTATMVAEEFEVLVETAEVEAEAKKTTEMLDATDLDNLQRRPPVVTIMGHVDHGKTTLLDSIRKTKVAQGEAGGITQHIGAYHVDIEHGGKEEQIVFLDTPGHEAFTAMRARGTRVTDIAILVVAADDGVRPQTIEAIKHAQAAEVPIVVAINKIDKEGAQPERVKQELTEYNLVPEEWGGETIFVPVSALMGENLDTLLEMIVLVSEVEDLYANPNRPARGTVIEANLDKARGPVATFLIQNGTLRVGDTLVAGSVFGKVRAMIGDRGNRVDEASPSFAVEVLGLSDVPAAGDEFEVFVEEKEARSVAGDRADQQRLSRLQQAMASRRVSLNTLSAQAQEGELKDLNLILKGDVQGSIEAILASLQQLPQDEIQIRVLFAAPGEITETDVDLAAASNAVVIGFNTTLASGARQAADRAGVDIREYEIIYKLLEDIQGAMEGLLEPELVEEPLGEVEVRAVFPVGKGAVAGCYVLSGKAIRNCRIRVNRGGEVVYEGNLDSLKRVRDDVKEVNAGYECGIGLGSFNGWQEGDIISTFRLATKRRTLASTVRS